MPSLSVCQKSVQLGTDNRAAGAQLPGGLLIPKVGDEYILWNIRMPKEYYTLAEQEFAEAVDEYLLEHDQDRYVRCFFRSAPGRCRRPSE